MATPSLWEPGVPCASGILGLQELLYLSASLSLLFSSFLDPQARLVFLVVRGTAMEECMDLPPGFRFHPTDEEIITHYLSPKVVNHGFSARAIGDVDLNRCEPWDLPGELTFSFSLILCWFNPSFGVLSSPAFFFSQAGQRWERKNGSSSAKGTGSTRPARGPTEPPRPAFGKPREKIRRSLRGEEFSWA